MCLYHLPADGGQSSEAGDSEIDFTLSNRCRQVHLASPLQHGLKEFG